MQTEQRDAMDAEVAAEAWDIELRRARQDRRFPGHRYLFGGGRMEINAVGRAVRRGSYSSRAQGSAWLAGEEAAVLAAYIAKFGPRPLAVDVTTLPQWAQGWSAEQVEAMVTYLAGLPLEELRQRQEIHAAQIQAAHSQGKHDAGLSERVKLDMTTDAVSRMTWGEPQGGMHTDRRNFTDKEG